MSRIIILFALAGLVSCAAKTKTPGASTPKESATATTAKGPDLKPEGNDVERSSKCVMGKDERELWFEKKSPAGCIVKYRKFGQIVNLGESEIDATYCRKMQAKIVGNLTAAGFSCQSASQATNSPTTKK